MNTLLQTAKFGTPLAQSLRILAAEFREARITRAEEKAARLPAMLTVPMILFILPTLFIVLLGPAILSIIDTFSHKNQAPATTVDEHPAGRQLIVLIAALKLNSIKPLRARSMHG